jgi:NAD(P)-dependent dehydrogenase (short-subunit alcohol dehydrogenase family)
MKRVAIVTGASRGLGRTVARLLARRGFDLVLGARSRIDLAAVTAELTADDCTVVPLDGDIVDASTREGLVNAAAALGGIDLLVNNASELGGLSALAATDLARLDRVLQANLIAPLALTQRALPFLKARRGLVVNVSSDAATGGYQGWGAYGASKAALDLISRTLATELTPDRVAVVSVDPGDMRTRMHQEAFPNLDISDRPLPEVTLPFWEWLLDQNPVVVNGQRFSAQQEDQPWTVRV